MDINRELKRVFQILNDIAPEGETTSHLPEGNPPSEETAKKFRNRCKKYGIPIPENFTTRKCCEHFIHEDMVSGNYALIPRGLFSEKSFYEKPDFAERTDYGVYDLEAEFYRYEECKQFRLIHGESGFRNPIVAYSLALLNRYGVLQRNPISENYETVLKLVVLRLKTLQTLEGVSRVDKIRNNKFLKLLTDAEDECIEYGLTDERCRGLFNLYIDICEVASQSNYIQDYAKELVDDQIITKFFKKYFDVAFSVKTQRFLAVFMLAYVPILKIPSSSSYREFAKTLDKVKNHDRRRIRVPNINFVRPGKFIGTRVFHDFYKLIFMH
ncbi:hypothetical protein GEMRC1_009949 [Eukaryota sp. GEM-RC1]